jgi:hypothetical protein
MLGDISNEALAKAVDPSVETSSEIRRSSNGSAFRGLLWAEWFTHSKLLLLFLCLWLFGVWVMPLFINPGWILLLGGIYALLAGPAYGGVDVLEGCEEFSFALPATRRQRYIARAVAGGGTLLLLTTMNLLALGLDLPQVLARLYIQTGIIKPLPVLKPGLLYGLVLALPLTVFAFSFALSSATHSRMFILTAWFWGGLSALAVLQLGFWYEEMMWESLNGYFTFPLLLAAGGIGTGIGCQLYRRKEIGQPSTPLTLPGKWWLWIILFLVGVCAALVLVSSLAKSYPKFLAPVDQR